MTNKILEKGLVSFSVAKLLKEIGFTDGSRASYIEYHSDFIYNNDVDHPESHKKGEVHFESSFYVRNFEDSDISNDNYTLYEAPYFFKAQEWLMTQGVRFLGKSFLYFFLGRMGLEYCPT